MKKCDTRHFENVDNRIELMELMKDISSIIDILDKYSDKNISINSIANHHKLNQSTILDLSESLMIPDDFIMDSLDNFKNFRMLLANVSINYDEFIENSLKTWKDYGKSKKKDIEQLDFDSIDVNKLDSDD